MSPLHGGRCEVVVGGRVDSHDVGVFYFSHIYRRVDGWSGSSGRKDSSIMILNQIIRASVVNLQET